MGKRPRVDSKKGGIGRPLSQIVAEQLQPKKATSVVAEPKPGCRAVTVAASLSASAARRTFDGLFTIQ